MTTISRRSIFALAACLALMALAAPAAQAAPDASFSFAPSPARSGLPVTLTSTSTAPLLFAVTNVEWDFDGDPATFEVSGTSVTRTFPTSGDHTFRMRVTSNELLDNQVIETMTIPIATRVPTAEFSFNPTNPSVGDSVLFANSSSDPDNDALTYSWNFGDGTGPSTARNPSHQYTTPGTKTVRLTVNDGKGGTDEVTHTVTVRDPSAANASFTFSPANPIQDEPVTFTSTSTPSSGQSITGQAWDLDSDGQYDDGTGKTATRRFDSPGVYRVALRVVQANGNPAVAEGTVRVGAIAATTPPGGTPPVVPPTPPSTPAIGSLKLLTPFPVVRLVGDVYVRRTVVKLLSVRAPRGSLARVRCNGKGCPKVSRRKRSKGKPLRFKTFERSLRAGARLEVFVVRSGRVGKFTRFKLRSRKIPLRTDLCVVPGKRKPRPCPS